MMEWPWLSDAAQWMQPFSARLATTLLHFLWQGAVIAAVLAVALRLLRGSRANVRYIAACLAMFSLPAAAVATWCLIESQEAVVVVNAAPATPVVGPLEQVDDSEPRVAVADAGEVIQPTPVASVEFNAEAPMEILHPRWDASPTQDWRELLVPLSPFVSLAYGVGVGWMLLRTLVSLWLGYQVRRSAEPCLNVDVLSQAAHLSKQMGLHVAPAIGVCRRIVSPAVAGLLKPIILLPPALLTQLTQQELAALLAHEMAHIRRHDMSIHIAQRVVESLLFFHPATWWISGQLSAEREHCCDDFAASTGASAFEYAAALLRMAELCTPARNGQFAQRLAALSASGDKPSLLARRVERLLGVAKTPQLNAPRLGAAGLLLAVVGIMSSVCVFAQTAPEQRLTEPAEDPAPEVSLTEPLELSVVEPLSETPLDDPEGKDEPDADDEPEAKDEPAADKPNEAVLMRTPTGVEWGEAVDGLRLGIRPSPKAKRVSPLRHGDVLRYQVWIRNESDRAIHIPRSPVEYRGISQRDKKINVAAVTAIMSFAVPTDAFEKATLTVPPGASRLLTLQEEVSALIRPAEEPQRAGMSPLRLAVGRHELHSRVQVFYHTEKEPNQPGAQSKAVTLESPTTHVEILPAARLRFQRLFRVSPEERGVVLSKSNYQVHKWSPKVGSTEQWVSDHSQPVLLDEHDILAVHGFSRSKLDRATLRVSLSQKASLQFAETTTLIPKLKKPEAALGAFLDGELISARILSQPVEGEYPLIPLGLTPGSAMSLEHFINESMFRCPCQTAWSQAHEGLKVGAKLILDEHSQRVHVKFVIRNTRDKPISINLGGRRGWITLESNSVRPLEGQIVRLGDHFQAAEYRVEPTLEGQGKLRVSARVILRKNDRLQETHLTIPRTILIEHHREPKDPVQQALAQCLHATDELMRERFRNTPGVSVAVEVLPGESDPVIKKRILVNLEMQRDALAEVWRKSTKSTQQPTGKQLETTNAELSKELEAAIKAALPQKVEGVDLLPTVQVLIQVKPGQPDELKPDAIRKQVTLKEHLNVRDVVIDRHGKTVTSVATERDVTIRTWNLDTGLLDREVKLKTELHGNYFLMSRMQLTPDARRLTTIVKNELKIWDAQTGDLIMTLPNPDEQTNVGSRVLATAMNGHLVAAATQLGFSGFPSNLDCEVLIWETDTRKMLARLKHSDAVQITSLAISADGRYIASGSQKASICVFDGETGELVLRLENDNGDAKHPDLEVKSEGSSQIVCLAFSPDEKLLAMGDLLGVKLIDLSTGKVVHRIDSPFRFGYSGLTFSADGRFLARVATDKTVPIWSTESGRLVATLPTEAHAGAFSRDGLLFATGFTDRTQALTVWRMSERFRTQPKAKQPAKGLGFLAPYPELHGLSLGMSREAFLKLAERKKLKPKSAPSGESYSLAMEDGHTVIVMFGGDRCNGIQRLRGTP